jgi:hypothetical protein
LITQWKQRYLRQNLTCTVCISKNGVEQIQFIQEGGQTNETYYDYFAKLVESTKKKYPEKKLVF